MPMRRHFMITHRARFAALIVAAVLLAAALPACSTPAQASDLHMISMDQLDPAIKTAPQNVQTAYRFAVANPDVMKNIPCYCGCGSIGHTSNYSCYVVENQPTGKLVYDYHATGCSICVDITQDAMRLLKDGKSVPEI